MSVSTQEFLAQIRRRLTEVTTDPRETMLLFQRLSIIVQRFNVGMPSWHVRNFQARIATIPDIISVV